MHFSSIKLLMYLFDLIYSIINLANVNYFVSGIVFYINIAVVIVFFILRATTSPEKNLKYLFILFLILDFSGLCILFESDFSCTPWYPIWLQLDLNFTTLQKHLKSLCRVRGTKRKGITEKLCILLWGSMPGWCGLI